MIDDGEIHTDHPAWVNLDIRRVTRKLTYPACIAVRITIVESEPMRKGVLPAPALSNLWTYDFAHSAYAASDLRVSTAFLQPNEKNRRHFTCAQHYLELFVSLHVFPNQGVKTTFAAVLAYLIPVVFLNDRFHHHQ